MKPFCKKLTSDLREISNDKHIFVFFSPEEAREVAARNDLLPPDEIHKINEYYKKLESRGNFGFEKIEILDGNVGYIDINWFSGSPKACKKVVGLMSFLSDTDAIIIDLRDNGGGGGSAGRLLMSYFFGEEKVPFTGVYLRETNKTEQSWSDVYIPGKRLPDIDLYILTSSKTFSAAEEFAYFLKDLKRAIIVGEPTAGGAHPVMHISVNGYFGVRIPYARMMSPVSKTDWEGTGVIPDIRVSMDETLEAACKDAVKNLNN